MGLHMAQHLTVRSHLHPRQWWSWISYTYRTSTWRVHRKDTIPGIITMETTDGMMPCNTWTIHKHNVNSLVPVRSGSNLKSVILKLIVQYNRLCIHCEIAIRWILQILTNEESTLVQAMVPSGNKPLPGAMLIKIVDSIWRHWVNILYAKLFWGKKIIFYNFLT